MRTGWILAAGVLLWLWTGYPYSAHPATRLYEPGDSYINLWILDWVGRAALDPTLSVWDAPQMVPAQGTLAFSENLFGVLPVSASVRALGGSPVLATNAVIAFGFLSLMVAAYAWLRRWAGAGAAFAVACLVAFNPTRWADVGHLQLLTLAPTVLLFLALEAWCQSGRHRWIALGSAALGWQALCSLYLGIQAALGACIWVLVRGLLEGASAQARTRWKTRLSSGRLWLTAALSATALGGLLWALAAPYRWTAAHWGFERTLGESALYSAEPLGWLQPHGFAGYRWLQAALPEGMRSGLGHTACLGLVLPVLAAAGLAAAWRHRRESAKRWRTAAALAAVGGAAAVLCLGPWMYWRGEDTGVPLPYSWFQSHFPGAGGMRVPVRFRFLTLLALAPLAAFGLERALAWVRRRSGPRWQLAAAAVAAGACAHDLWTPPSPGVELPVTPSRTAAYTALGPGALWQGPLLEFPGDNHHVYPQLWWQTQHRQPLVGGLSGWVTPGWKAVTFAPDGFPPGQILEDLSLCPARAVFVHTDQMTAAAAQAWREQPPGDYGFEDGGTRGPVLVWTRREAPVSEGERCRVLDWLPGPQHLLVGPGAPGQRWIRPDLGPQPVRITWAGEDGSVLEENQRVQWPPYIPEGTTRRVPLAPPRPGMRLVALSGPSLAQAWRAPASAAPATCLAELRGSIEVLSGEPPGTLPPKRRFQIYGRGCNRGRGSWRCFQAMEGDKTGAVLVAVRWHRLGAGRQETFAQESYLMIDRALSPGESDQFGGWVQGPAEPGEYRLELNLAALGWGLFPEGALTRSWRVQVRR